jgi:formylglycine-generating enzyme required for sulfatase activity
LVSINASTVLNTAGNQQELLNLDRYDCQISWDGRELVVDSGKEDYPCIEITWYGSACYANYLSEREGLTPCYDLVDWSCDFSADGYRLPTEAEWEYAARGGLDGARFPWGDTITHKDANYFSDRDLSYDLSSTRGFHPDYDTSPYTSSVHSFAANGYGLYHMAGNVWEWCNDWYSGNYYSSSEATNPGGPASGVNRVRRGGGQGSYVVDCRVASRSGDAPHSSAGNGGFRLVYI